MSNGRFLGRCKCRRVCTGPCREPSKADLSTPSLAVCLPPSTRRLPDSALLGRCTPRQAVSIIISSSSISFGSSWMIGSLLTCSASSRCHHCHLIAITIISLPSPSFHCQKSHCHHRHLTATIISLPPSSHCHHVISLPPSSHCHHRHLIATNVISLPLSLCHHLIATTSLGTKR